MPDVRRLRSTDRAGWTPLWQAYLDFYSHELPATTTESVWSRLVGEDQTVRGLCVTENEELVGLCHLVIHPSTWSPTTVCYLEDLFVRPERRASGLGRALIDRAEAEVSALGCTKLYWHTQEQNSTARRLYDDVASYDGFIVYEVDL